MDYLTTQEPEEMSLSSSKNARVLNWSDIRPSRRSKMRSIELSTEKISMRCAGAPLSTTGIIRSPRHTENPYCEMVTPLRPFVVQDPSLFSRLPGHKRVSISVSKEMEFLGMPGCPAFASRSKSAGSFRKIKG